MQKNIFFFSFVLTIICSICIVGIREVQASEVNLNGWAWSSNIGWISFNSANDSGASCDNYCVKVDSSGAITGWAWSSNIGWIKFGGLSDFPTSDSAAIANNANVNLVTGANFGHVTGWARACAGTQSGDCSTMNSRTDGWDGWINLSGTNHMTGDVSGTGGITYVPGITVGSASVYKGYAWGSDVVGWIQFNPMGSLTGKDVNCITGDPACPNGGSSLSGSCHSSPSPATDLTAPAVVIMSASAMGGTPGSPNPYTYSWTTDGTTYSAYDTSNTKTITTSSDNGNIKAKIKDGAGSEIIVSCPAITIKTTVTTPTSDSNLDLYIGSSLSNAIATHRTNLTVSQGSPFTLVWNTYGKLCSETSIKRKYSSGGYFPYSNMVWNMLWVVGASVGQKDVVMPTSDIPLGDYRFTLDNCRDLDGNYAGPVYAYLHVGKSSVIEQ